MAPAELAVATACNAISFKNGPAEPAPGTVVFEPDPPPVGVAPLIVVFDPDVMLVAVLRGMLVALAVLASVVLTPFIVGAVVGMTVAVFAGVGTVEVELVAVGMEVVVVFPLELKST